MKFPRNARILRGHLDAAPFVSVLFLVVIFVMAGSLLYTPGVRVELPQGEGLPGTDQPTVAVAVDANGRLYFQNQVVDGVQLQSRLREAAAHSPAPLTLVIMADKAVTTESLVNLTLLATNAGIYHHLLATRPSMFTPARSIDSMDAR
jgi:biopolymer transport protein ExbD